MAAQKKVAGAAAAIKALPAKKAPSAKTTEAAAVVPVVSKDDIVNCICEAGTDQAKVLAVHGGNALDLLVMPEDGPAFTIGSVPHECSKGNQKIYWNQ